MPRFLVILPAAGRGTRFGGDKLAEVVAGRTVLEWSVAAFDRRADVAAVVVGGRDCPGGENRAETVAAALRHAAGVEAEFVAVHDAARPAVSRGLIDRVFAAAVEYGAAVPGVAVTDTVKRVRDGTVVETPPRAELVAVQTPQAMRRDWLADALARCPVPLAAVTDDARLLELAGYPVRVVEGEASNLKLTRPADLGPLGRALGSQSGAVATTI